MRRTLIGILFLLGSTLAAQDLQLSGDLLKAQGTGTLAVEPTITKEQAAKILQELQMIRMLLEKELEARKNNDSAGLPLHERGARNDSPERTLADLGEHVIGSDKAPLTLVEFVDLQCSFCIYFHNEILPDLKHKYIDTGKLRFAVFDFPLPSQPYSSPAAKFVRCAGLQGKYWQAHDAFLAQAQIATPDVITKLARENQVDERLLNKCMGDTRTADELGRATEMARSLGVSGTPTFLLGRSLADGVTGRMIDGVLPVTAFDAKIQGLLQQPQLAAK